MTLREQLIANNPKLVESIKRKYNDKIWVRTCQECGHIQKDIEPSNYDNLSDAYCERRCKNCNSKGAFDLGSHTLRYKLTEEENDFISKLNELEEQEDIK